MRKGKEMVWSLVGGGRGGPGRGGAQNEELPTGRLWSFELGHMDLCFGSRPGC